MLKRARNLLAVYGAYCLISGVATRRAERQRDLLTDWLRDISRMFGFSEERRTIYEDDYVDIDS